MSEETKQDINPEEPTPDNPDTEKELQGEEEQPREEEANEPEEPEEKEDEPKEEEPEEKKPSGIMALASELAKKEFESDQQATEELKEIVTELQDYKKQAGEREEKLMTLFNENPDLVDLTHLVNMGASIEEALPYITGEATVDIDQAKEGWKKKAGERQKAKTEQKKRLDQVNTNLKKSFEEFDEFAKERNMDDNKKADFLTKIDSLMEEIAEGRISKETMSSLYKGLIHEETVKEAAETAEVRGRNEAIKDMKTKKKTQTGDGLPHPKSASTDSEESYDDTSPDAVIGAGIKHYVDSKKF